MNHLPQHFLKALIEYLLQDRKFVILMKHFVFLKAKQHLTLAALFIRVVEKLYVGQSQLKKLKDFFKNIVFLFGKTKVKLQCRAWIFCPAL